MRSGVDEQRNGLSFLHSTASERASERENRVVKKQQVLWRDTQTTRSNKQEDTSTYKEAPTATLTHKYIYQVARKIQAV